MEVLAEIGMELVKISPIVAVLVGGIIYLYRAVKSYKKELKEEREKCDEKIEDLNKELRETEKENLMLFNKLADSLDKMANSNKVVHNEIKNLKEIISIKLDNLRDGR